MQASASASDLQEETLRVLEQERSSQPISAAELERARIRWLNHWEQQFADAEQVGLALSESRAQGDCRLFFQLRDRVKNLGLADLQRVAESYLRPANRSLARYIPTEQPQRAPAPALVQASQQLQDFKPGPAAPVVPPFEATPAEVHGLSQMDRLASGLPDLGWSEQDLNSSWHLGARFAPQNKAQVELAFKQELALALSQGFSARELREAQQAMLSERRLARAQDPLLAATLAHKLFMGRDVLRSQAVDEAIAKLSMEQLNSALRRNL